MVATTRSEVEVATEIEHGDAGHVVLNGWERFWSIIVLLTPLTAKTCMNLLVQLSEKTTVMLSDPIGDLDLA